MTISEENELSEDRRKCQRFMAMEGAFALIRSGPSGLDQIETMSRGEIAIAIYKSKPFISYQKHNLKPILVHYIYHKNERGKTCQTDLPY